MLTILPIILSLAGLYHAALLPNTGNEMGDRDYDSIAQLNSAEGTIPNQYVVTLREGTSDSTMQSLVNQVENKGAHIIHIYDQSLSGFSFVTSDTGVANEIVNFLREKPQVESVIPDHEISYELSGLPN